MEWGFALQVQEGRAAGGGSLEQGSHKRWSLPLSSCVGLILEHVGRVGGCLQDTNKRRFFVALWVEA